MSYASTWLCVKQSVYNFYFAILAVISYSILFYSLDLFASMSLQLILLPILIVGLYQWYTKKESKTTSASLKTIINIVILSLITTGITLIFSGKLPLLDSTIFFLSLIAQYLLILKKVETWLVWIIVNVISIYVYYQSGAYLATLQYVLFLLNAFYGYYEWKKVRVNEATEA